MFNNSSEKNRYSLRKLSVGLASVLIGISFIEANGQTAKADTTTGGNTAAISTKVEKTANGNQNAASNANAGQESVKENGSQNYNANDSAEATVAKNEAVKGTIIAAKAALDAEAGTQKANTPVANQANTDAKGVVNEAQTGSAEQQNGDNNSPTADGNTSASGNKSATALLQKDAQAAKNVVTENAKDAQTADKDTQTLDVNKNSQKFSKKVLATNLIENQNNDDWADPAKQGFHYTTAGWTTEQQGKDYTDVAKKSHTILINQGTGKELDKNNSYEVGQGSGWGVDITATVDKSLIKQGNKILISNVALLSKDTTRMLQYTVQSANTMNIVSNGVKIGHIEAVSNYEPSSHRNMSYFLIVDQTQNMAKDLNLHFKINNSYTFNDQSAHFGYYKGTTPSNPAQFKLITNNSDLYNYTIYVDPNKTEKPYKVDSLDEIGSYLNQRLNDGEIDLGHIQHNPSQSFNIQDFAINRVFKLSRPKEINNIVIPNFKSSNFNPTLGVNTYYPILNKDGYLDGIWEAWYGIKGQKLADGLSVQQVNELAKKNHVVFSISNDGQSMLIGINIVPSLANLTKLSNQPKTINQITNEVKYYLYGSRAVAIDYPNDATNIINYSTNWIKNNNGEPYHLEIELTGFPKSYLSPLVQNFTDVTPNINNPISKTDTYVPNGYDINVDASVYKQLNVKFVDDDNNEKVINTDTFTTSTGTDLTYNIKDATDKTFNSATDIAFPKNFVLGNNQATSVHYGVIQNINPDIVIHVKHLVKVVSGDTDLDLYPDIQKALNSDAIRTITFDYPAGHQNLDPVKYPTKVTQSIHYIRSGKADFTTDTVDESTCTKWNPVASSAKGVTIDKDGNTTFDAIPIPKIPGYKAQFVQDKANPAMFLVSFMVMPNQGQDNNESKDNHNTTPTDPVQPVNPSDDTKHDLSDVEVPVIPSDPEDDQDIETPDEPEVPTVPVDTDVVKDASDVITMNKPADAPVNAKMHMTDSAWHIKNKATTDTSYTVANSEYELRLPRFTGYTLRLVKRNAARDAISFVYVNPNKTLKYVFNIKLTNGKYILTIGKVTEDGIIQLEKVTFSDYKQLIQLIAKAVNK